MNNKKKKKKKKEDRGSKLAQANSFRVPISKKTITKQGCEVARSVGSEFKPPILQKKKKKSTC
jgi:hypothetical protein